MKKIYAIIIVVIVTTAVVFFSIFWPLNSTESLKGTIGGVEKAEKFRGDQPMSKDVLMENEDFAALTQGAEWQNAMKNEKLVSFLKSDEFKNFVLITGDMQKIAILNGFFDTVKNSLLAEPELNEEVVKAVFAKDEFQKFILPNSQDFQQEISILLQDYQNVFCANLDSLEAVDFVDAMRFGFATNSDINKFFSADMQKLVNSKNFDKLVNSKNFDKLVNSKDFQLYVSQDFQLLMQSALSFVFPLPNNQNFQNTLNLSQNFQKQFMSYDMQQLVNNEDFQKIAFNQDFEQNMLGAFQDYMNIILMSH